MKFLPDKVGGNPKQYAILGVLVVAMVGVYFWMMRDDSAPVATPAAPTPAAKAPSPTIARQSPAADVNQGAKLETRAGARDQSFRPSIKVPEGTDITKIDPTLKLELLAKLQKVPLEGGARSIFDYGAPPVPPPPPVAPIKPGMSAVNGRPGGPGGPGGPSALGARGKPAAPPIPLKFYGYANRAAGPARQAFFLDGDDIQIKGENDVIKGRYKIIRIGINSAVVEDMQTQNQQTLPLVAEVQS